MDNLTARIVQQEQAIETLNYHVNMMRGSKDQISSTKISKKETKKSSEKREIEDQSPSNLQFSNGTLNVQKPAKRTDKPWHNKGSFNMSSTKEAAREKNANLSIKSSKHVNSITNQTDV